MKPSSAPYMRRKMHTGFSWGNLEERNTWEDLRIDGILKCTLIQWGEGGGALAQDRNRWRAVVNTVTNLRVSYTEYFSTS